MPIEQELPAFEYRVTFAKVPETFPSYSNIQQELGQLSPKPPQGGDWQLAGSTALATVNGLTILYQWERPFRNYARNA